MYTFFLVCAGVGGTLVLLQFLAGAFGFGGDHGDAGHHDFGTDHAHDGHGHGSDANWFLGFLTFRAISAAIAFFGLGGLIAAYYDMPRSAQLATAVLSAFVALYLVATLMQVAVPAQGRRQRSDRARGRPHGHRLPACPAAKDRAGEGYPEPAEPNRRAGSVHRGGRTADRNADPRRRRSRADLR